LIPFHLRRKQHGQRQKSGAPGTVHKAFRHSFQFAPTVPSQIGCIDDLAKQASPFRDRALNVTVPEQLVHELVTRRLIFNDFSNYFRRTGSVCRRDTHFQIAGKIGSSISLLANETKAAAELRFVHRESVAGPQIAQVKYEIFHRVIRMFQRRRDRKSFPVVEKTEEDATPGRFARFSD
jgi:hypothetical protein